MTNCDIDLTARPKSSVFLNGPADLVSAVPYLLGFTPRDCIVAAFLGGADGELLLTARVNHPQPGEHPAFVAAWQKACEDIANSNDVDRVVLVDFCTQSTFGGCAADDDLEIPRHESSDHRGSVRYLTGVMADAAAQAGLYTCDEVMVINERWRSVLCHDHSCCPIDGQLMDPDRGARVAAPFVAQGVAPLASRDSIRERIEPVAGDDPRRVDFQAQVNLAQERVSECGDIADRRAFVLEAVLALTTEISQGVPLAVACIQDMRRRDAFLRILVHDIPQAPRRVAEEMLTNAVSLCADSDRAALATVIAGLAWQRGDGAVAQECLNLALAADAGYSLARLLDRAIRHAVPPSVWVDAVSATTVESCLIGS